MAASSMGGKPLAAKAARHQGRAVPRGNSLSFALPDVELRIKFALSGWRGQHKTGAHSLIGAPIRRQQCGSIIFTKEAFDIAQGAIIATRNQLTAQIGDCFLESMTAEKAASQVGEHSRHPLLKFGLADHCAACAPAPGRFSPGHSFSKRPSFATQLPIRVCARRARRFAAQQPISCRRE